MRLRDIGPLEVEQSDGTFEPLTLEDFKGDQGDPGQLGPLWKLSVRVASIVDVSRAAAGSRTIDGVALAPGDRVLLRTQANASQNGIYVVGGDFALQRTADADTAAEIEHSATTVTAGDTYANKAFICTTNEITLGTTDITWAVVEFPIPPGLDAALDAQINVWDPQWAGGVKMDGVYAVVSTSVGDPDVASTSFVDADVGKAILIPGAGTAGAALLTTITAVDAGVSATVDDTPSVAVTAALSLYGTDDTAAWEAVYDRLYALRGGTIVVSPPDTGVPNTTSFSVITRAIDAAEAEVVDAISHLQGGNVVGTSGGGSAAPVIVYLAGAGADPMFRFLSCLYTHLKGLDMWIANPDFDGDLVRFEHGLDGDAMFNTAEQCRFSNAATATAPGLNSYLKMHSAIFCHAIECFFGENYVGSGIELGTGYVNACSARRCVFSHCRNHILISSGTLQAFAIDGNTFEPTWGGQAGAVVGTNACNIYALSIRDNWFGDVELGGRSWLENLHSFTGVIEIAGNFMASPGNSHGITVATVRAGSGSVNEQQRIRVTGTAGNFTITTDVGGGAGQTTANIDLVAAAANANVVKTALEALSNIAPGDVVVTAQHGPTHDYPITGRHVYFEWLVEFQGTYALTNVNQMTATDVSLTGYGAYMNLGGTSAVWDIHTNNLGGSGALLDRTLTHGGLNSAPSLRLHSNVVSASLTPFIINGTLADLDVAGYTAYLNKQSPVIIPENFHRDRSPLLISVYPHTFSSLNAGRRLYSNATATAATFTIPPDADDYFVIGHNQEFMQGGSGQITIAAGAGVTLRVQPGYQAACRGQYSVIKLHKKAANEWVLSGDLAPIGGSKTHDFASVADGAFASTTVTATGAALGDHAVANLNVASGVPAGAILSAHVTSANTVTVTLVNHTGAPLDLASGTLSARVFRG